MCSEAGDINSFEDQSIFLAYGQQWAATLFYMGEFSSARPINNFYFWFIATTQQDNVKPEGWMAKHIETDDPVRLWCTECVGDAQ